MIWISEVSPLATQNRQLPPSDLKFDRTREEKKGFQEMVEQEMEKLKDERK